MIDDNKMGVVRYVASGTAFPFDTSIRSLVLINNLSKKIKVHS